MKYWKGKFETPKEGQVGTMDDNGHVPDSVELSEQEYLDYIKNLSVLDPEPESDIDKLIRYAKIQKWIK